MTVLLAILAVIAGIGAYLAAGMRIAGRPYVTRSVQRQCEEFPRLAARDAKEWRREAAFEALFVAAVWPVYLGFRALISRVADSAPLSDYELRQQLAERDRRIADLERELEIDRRRA